VLDLSLIRSTLPIALILKTPFRAVLSGLGEYQIGRVSGKASLNMAYPTFDAGGELDGIVFAGLDLAFLSAIIAAAQVPESYLFTVVDRKGTILARHPNPEQWLGKPAVESGFSQNSSARAEGIAQRIGLDGKEHLYAYKSFGDLTGKSDLQISMSIPSEVALSEANWVLKRNLAALMIVGLLALLTAWVGSEMFVLRQLNALVTTTEKSAKASSVRAPDSFTRIMRSADWPLLLMKWPRS
jgi:hypothetical protein